MSKIPQPRWLTPTQAAGAREESDYFYALLFMPAINNQSLSLSFEIREMPEVVVHVTK